MGRTSFPASAAPSPSCSDTSSPRRVLSPLVPGAHGMEEGGNAPRPPMVPGGFDYGRKECRFGEPILASGDLQADIEKFRAFYRGVQARRPELFGEIRVPS